MKKIALILTALALSLSASSFTKTHKLKVISSTPMYQNIVKQIPYQECWDERVPYRHQNYPSSYDSSLGTLIGGVAGGILGNQIGKGRGKTVATVSGAIIGTLVGNNLSQERYYHESRPSHVTRQRCETRYTQSYQEEFIGYKNIAYHHGREIVKITPHKQRFITVTSTFYY